NFEAEFYLNVDFIRQVALLADLDGVIIGGARYYIWSPGQADIAFIVGDAYQNQGIASAMLRHLAFIARDAGISDLHAHTLPDNRRALPAPAKPGPPPPPPPPPHQTTVTPALCCETRHPVFP